jgi:Sulphur transport
MTAIELIAILAPLSFVVGFALQRGNVCTVLAARQIVWTGRWSRLRGLLLTSAWGFAILMPIAWLGIEPLKLGNQVMPGLLTVAAGVLYAIGCFVNGACIFGVCSRTTAGHISFAFAIPAMGIGATLGQRSGIAPTPKDLTPTLATSPSSLLIAAWAAILIWLAWISLGLIANYRRAGITIPRLLTFARWRSSFAAIIIGLLGAALFATDTAWFYPAAAKRLTLFFVGFSDKFPLDSLIGGVGLFLGGMAAALLNGRAAMRPPHLVPSIKAIIGGLIIGFAWALIPGGNDAMVLYLLPSLALNGIVAYVAMLASLIALETLSRKFGSAH